MREVVKFVANVPQEVALAYPTGKPVAGQYGDQMMFSLAGNRVMYLDPLPAAMIASLNPAVGEPFMVCKKWTGRRGDQVQWDVYLRTERGVDSELERKLRDSIMLAEGRKAAASAASANPASSAEPSRGNGTYGPAPVAAPAVRQIPQKRQYHEAYAMFLVAAGRAAKVAETTLGAEGGSVRFDSRDIAAIATSMFIAADKHEYVTWDGK